MALTEMKYLWRIYLDLTEIVPQERIPRASGVSLSDIRQAMVAEHFINRLTWIIMKINRELKVKEPFGSSPTRPPKYEVRLTNMGNGKFQLLTFAALYSAKKYIEAVSQNDTPLDLSYEAILANGVKIKSRHLRAILGYEYDSEEAQWQLPLPYNYYARTIVDNTPYAGDPQRPEPKVTSLPKLKAPDPAPASSKSSKRTKKASASPSPTPTTFNLKDATPKSATFGIPDLAYALNMDGKKIRGLLRKHFTKPTEGWTFPTKKFQEISKKLANCH